MVPFFGVGSIVNGLSYPTDLVEYYKGYITSRAYLPPSNVIGICSRVSNQDQGLIIRMGPPSSGPADPRPLFTYHSTIATGAEFGTGWNCTYKRNVTSGGGSSATVNTDTGAGFGYTGLDATNYYTPPAGVQNSLKKEASGWTETQPDGTAFRYNSSGQMMYVKNPAGARWTTTFQGTLLQRITDPFGNRMSFIYNSLTNKIRRVVDAWGRITSFTFNGNFLAGMTTPDLNRTTLAYNTFTILSAYVNPKGDRTSFVYGTGAGTQKVQAAVAPLGQRITYTGSTTQMVTKNSLGVPTTLVLDTSGNVKAALNPSGGRATFGWATNGFLQMIQDERGNRTTFTSVTATDKTARLQSIQDLSPFPKSLSL
jgi:hypothetical protein